MRKKCFMLIGLVSSSILFFTGCGKANNAPETGGSDVTAVIEETTEEVSQNNTEIDDKQEEREDDNNVADAIPDKDFNDMTYVMPGSDFRRSKWGDNIDTVANTEPVWEDYKENPNEAEFDGGTVYNRTFASEYGSFGRTVCYYCFDENGDLYKGYFVTAFDGTEGIEKAADEIYEKLKDKQGKHAIDNKYVNCSTDTFEKDLATGQALRLSGWELDDGTMIIETVMPIDERLNALVVGYYNPSSKHSMDGIGGVPYKVWTDLSGTSSVSEMATSGDLYDAISLVMTYVADGCDSRNAKIGDSLEKYKSDEKDFKLEDELRSYDDMPDKKELYGNMLVNKQTIHAHAYFDKDDKLCGVFYDVSMGSRAEADALFEELKKAADEEYGKPTKETDMGFQVTTEYINKNGTKVDLMIVEEDEKHEHVQLRFGDA